MRIGFLVWPAAAATALACSSSKDTTPADPPPDCTEHDGTPPVDLQCSGLYSDWKTKTLSPDVKEFSPAIELFVDGAEKTRWLYLPPGSKIDTSDMDEWKFPAGTKVWKEFRLNGKKIETRLFYKQPSGRWVWGAYVWNDDLSKAPFSRDGKKDVVGTYEIPDAQGCDKCHRGRAEKLLGVEAVSLGLAGAKGVTLASLASEGRLTAPPAKTALAIPEDSTGKAGPALGWLHTQCGVSCHNRNPFAEGTKTSLFLRLQASQLLGTTKTTDLDAYKTTANVPIDTPKYFSYQAQGFVRMKPGDPNHSLILAFAAMRDEPGAMPPLYTHIADQSGIEAAKAWIAALPP
jgi:hypothetical protein